MFGRYRISTEICKDYISSMFRNKNFVVDHESSTNYTISFIYAGRKITISMTKDNNKIILDIVDEYGFIQIPKGKFKDFTKFREFCINNLSRRFQ